MTTRDYDTELDQALARIAQDKGPEVTGGVPEVGDGAVQSSGGGEMVELIAAARRLQILAPAPEPRLEEGRRRFMNEARRLAGAGNTARPLEGLALGRPLSYAIAVLVLLFGITFAVVVKYGIVDGTNSAPAPLLATPALSPTYVVTPTKIARNAPLDARPAFAPLVTSPAQLPQPAPAPEPGRARMRLDYYSELVSWSCLKS